jgi:hypothetical protein
VGLVTFDENLVDKLPRAAVWDTSRAFFILDKVNPTSSTEFHRPLLALAETFHRRGIVVLISDLYAPASDIISSLRQFRYRGNDMVVFHVLDQQEKDFKFSKAFRLEDMETKREVLMVPGRLGEYLTQLNVHIEAIKECGVLGIDYLLLDTSRPLDYALYSYLATRRNRCESATRSACFQTLEKHWLCNF